MADQPKPKPVRVRPIVSRPDYATIGGLVMAFGGILGGLLLEGGKIKDVAQITAACIVFGGTFGAVMVTSPFPVLLRAVRKVNKLRSRLRRSTQIKELMLEGVVAIVEGLNPKLIRTKLEAYAREADAASKPEPKRVPVRHVEDSDAA